MASNQSRKTDEPTDFANSKATDLIDNLTVWRNCWWPDTELLQIGSLAAATALHSLLLLHFGCSAFREAPFEICWFSYLIFVIFFTLAKFLENKIYTEKRQFFALNL